MLLHKYERKYLRRKQGQAKTAFRLHFVTHVFIFYFSKKKIKKD
jgi:hypothetical protein